MSPRLTLRTAASPLVIAGALWCGSAISPALGGGQTPPPCSPDGVCLPNYETWGHYQTRWRAFPGDRVTTGPTEAETTPDEQLKIEEQLGGPQTPEANREDDVAIPRAERRSQGQRPQGAAPQGAAPGAEEMPEELPDLSTIEGAQPAPQGNNPDPLPGAGLPDAGEETPLVPSTTGDDPFGAKRSTAPTWLTKNVPAAPQLNPLPEVFAPAVPAPAAQAEPISQRPAPTVDGPNLYGDDAPPALPASLQCVSQGRLPKDQWPDALNALPPVVQPPSVLPTASTAPTVDSRVTPTSVQHAAGAAPGRVEAAAVLQPLPPTDSDQAIYFEASDR